MLRIYIFFKFPFLGKNRGGGGGVVCYFSPLPSPPARKLSRADDDICIESHVMTTTTQLPSVIPSSGGEGLSRVLIMGGGEGGGEGLSKTEELFLSLSVLQKKQKSEQLVNCFDLVR